MLLSSNSHGAQCTPGAGHPTGGGPRLAATGLWTARHGLFIVTADPGLVDVWLDAPEYGVSGAETLVTVKVTHDRR